LRQKGNGAECYYEICINLKPVHEGEVIMLKYASWVHGNTLAVERPGDVVVQRWGWGTELRTHTSPSPSTWCHIAIPTPVIINDARMKVQNLFLLFETGQHASIDNIHIYDGPDKIAAWDVVAGSNYSARRSGHHSKSIDGQNTFVLPAPHEVRFGLSISFTFIAVAQSAWNDPEARLLITTAGADFF
jgi:hypothetical protein